MLGKATRELKNPISDSLNIKFCLWCLIKLYEDEVTETCILRHGHAIVGTW